MYVPLKIPFKPILVTLLKSILVQNWDLDALKVIITNGSIFLHDSAD